MLEPVAKKENLLAILDLVRAAHRLEVVPAAVGQKVVRHRPARVAVDS
jgi:hypothetical protein